MTTEVYRNMLLEEGGDRFVQAKTSSLSYWPMSAHHLSMNHTTRVILAANLCVEEVICSPPNVQLVGLSNCE